MTRAAVPHYIRDYTRHSRAQARAAARRRCGERPLELRARIERDPAVRGRQTRGDRAQPAHRVDRSLELGGNRHRLLFLSLLLLWGWWWSPVSRRAVGEGGRRGWRLSGRGRGRRRGRRRRRRRRLVLRF